jgi:membrane associated rhomboid family serine protease
MIPLRDENVSESPPVVTRGLIVLNILAFVYELTLGPGLRDFMLEWGMVPMRLARALELGSEPLAAPGATLISSLFIHGGWLHLVGNMWYLWIFGDNVEDRLGKVRFLLFYLLAGVVASLVHFVSSPASRLPTVGASGAIAAVLGGYAVAYPSARVITLVPLFPFVQIMALPALAVLLLWFVFQFFSGFLSLGFARQGGVAWWAHIGGFAFGAIAMFMIGGRRRPRARPSEAWPAS